MWAYQTLLIEIKLVLTGISKRLWENVSHTSQKFNGEKNNKCQLPAFHAPPFWLPPIPRCCLRAVTHNIGCHSNSPLASNEIKFIW